MTNLVLEADQAATSMQVTDTQLVVGLTGDRTLLVPLDWYPRLQHATPDELHNYHVLGNRYAIEWPDPDEHIGLEGLLAGRRSGGYGHAPDPIVLNLLCAATSSRWAGTFSRNARR